MKEEIYRAMIYKTGGVDMGCSDCCKKTFNDPQGAVKYQMVLFWTAFFLMVVQCFLTVVLGSLDTAFYVNLPSSNYEA